MSLTFLDHVVFTVIAVLLPLNSWYSMRKLRQLIASGDIEFDLPQQYRILMAVQWFLFAMVLALWIWTTRPIQTLGLTTTSPGPLHLLAAVVLSIAGVVASLFQLRKAQHSEEFRQTCRDGLQGFDMLLPKNQSVLRWFYGVSLTAGVCEELMFRGFLIWYLSPLAGLIPAILISSLIFGLAHAYQGFRNVPRVALIGLYMSVLYVLSGSLWLPMIMHFLIDVIIGKTIYIAFRDQPMEPPQHTDIAEELK